MPLVTIVGGGVAGSALAIPLARRGVEVLVLEKSRVHVDRVRGEWIAIWGVDELKVLGLYEHLTGAGAHHTEMHCGFTEEHDPKDLESVMLSAAIPGIVGPLCLRHPIICESLNQAAVEARARILRGVENIELVAGPRPAVSYIHNGEHNQVSCDLVVGADGRGSAIGRKAGIQKEADPPHHLMSGLLVRDAYGWPEKVQTIGTERDVTYFIFPQGRGWARLYLCHDRSKKSRFSGPIGAEQFLQAFLLKSVPGSEALANATPAGPCHGYPNEDVWSDRPISDGVVLIGDAAGHNDPIIGQGLSIALRDARLVSEILNSTHDWRSHTFEPYVEERRERMRRLRFVARLYSKWRAEFGEEAAERRRVVANTMLKDRDAWLPIAATQCGPHRLPKEIFEPRTRARFFGGREVGDDSLLSVT